MKRIPTSTVLEVAGAIRRWEGGRAPTWREVGDIAGPICGREVSRQWLCTTPEIKAAYEDKQRSRRERDGDGPSPRAKSAKGTIAKLRADLAERDRKLAEYDQQLAAFLEVFRKRQIHISEAMPPRPIRN